MPKVTQLVSGRAGIQIQVRVTIRSIFLIIPNYNSALIRLDRLTKEEGYKVNQCKIRVKCMDSEVRLLGLEFLIHHFVITQTSKSFRLSDAQSLHP